MFMVDEPAAEAIRRAYEDGGELSGIVEFKRRFPLISDHAKARECVRIIAGWLPVPKHPEAEQKRRRKPAKPAVCRALPAISASLGPPPACVGRELGPDPGRPLILS